MNLNDTLNLPPSIPFSRSDLLSMDKILRGIRESGEIHIETTGTGLILKLMNPHHAMDGTPLSDEGLTRRGISSTLEFIHLRKIAITDTTLELFPLKTPGSRARKRTLKFLKRSWVSTKRAFFSDFVITDTHS